jgi:hypothetical protein
LAAGQRHTLKLGVLVIVVSGLLEGRKGTVEKHLNGNTYRVGLEGSGIVVTISGERLHPL